MNRAEVRVGLQVVHYRTRQPLGEIVRIDGAALTVRDAQGREELITFFEVEPLLQSP